LRWASGSGGPPRTAGLRTLTMLTVLGRINGVGHAR
jgi:hypothetical protein